MQARAQPSAEIVRVEGAKCRRECVLYSHKPSRLRVLLSVFACIQHTHEAEQRNKSKQLERLSRFRPSLFTHNQRDVRHLLFEPLS